MSTVSFNYSVAGIFTTNTFLINSGNSGGVEWDTPNEQCGQWRFNFYGEQLQFYALFASTNPITVVIDGGSATTPSITSNGSAMQTITLASGLSVGSHSIVIRFTGSIRPASTNAFIVTDSSGSPAISASTGYATFLKIGSSGLLAEGHGATYNQFNYSYNRRANTGFEYHRFRAQTASLPVFFISGSTCYVQLYVDGTLTGTPSIISNPSTSGGYFDFVDLAALVGATLDGTAYHQYEVVYATSGPSIYVYVAGYAMSIQYDSTATYPTRPQDGYMGDSICRGYDPTSVMLPFSSWTYITSRNRGAVAINVGVDGSTIESLGTSQATLLVSLGNFNNLFSEYGTNDMAIAGTTTPNSTFQSAVISELNTLLAGSTGKVRRFGIFPRSGILASTVLNWNGTGNGIQGAIAACNSPSNVTYINPLWPGLVDPTDYSEVSPTERLHPNALGQALIANIATPFAATTGYTAVAPATHSAGSASSNGTVSIANGATFTGIQTITIASSNGTDTITPSVGSAGTGSVTVTPTSATTSFTFTISRNTAGTSTLTFTNGQGWTNPSTSSYTATSNILRRTSGLRGGSRGSRGI